MPVYVKMCVLRSEWSIRRTVGSIWLLIELIYSVLGRVFKYASSGLVKVSFLYLSTIKYHK